MVKAENNDEVKMIITHQIRHLDIGPVTIRAVRSLTKSDVELIDTAVSALPTEWSIDLHDDYDGYLSAIIQPVDHNAPTFLVSGTTERVEISMLDSEDRMLNRGRFTNIDAATARLIVLLAAEPN